MPMAAHRTKPSAVSLAVSLMLAAGLPAGPAQAAGTLTGSYFTIGDPALPSYCISNGVDVSPFRALTVKGGSVFATDGLVAAWNQGKASVTIDGLGSTLSTARSWSVGRWGLATMTVSGGAQVLDAAGTAGLGVSAGSSGTLLITGAGTRVAARNPFSLASGQVSDDGANTGTMGMLGAASTATLRVLDGATLSTGRADTGAYNTNGFLGNGLEQRSAVIQVKGAGSLWTLTGTTDPVFNFASLVTSASAGSTTQPDISDGGKIRLTGVSSYGSWVDLGGQGGSSTARISGAGSGLEWASGTAGRLNVGISGSSSFLDVSAGGYLAGLIQLTVGSGNGSGTLNLSGVDSRILLDGHTAGQGFSGIAVGTGGAGRVNVSSGAQLVLAREVAGQFGLALSVGTGSSGQGQLTVSGAGSVLRVAQASVVAGGGASEVQNPSVSIGTDGMGSVLVSIGGKLLVEGNAVSAVGAQRFTLVHIGGNGGSAVGGTGSVTVTGAGSQFGVAGSDAFMAVGRGAGSTGRLAVNAGGLVTGTVLNVGRLAATGVLSVDGGQLQLSGQYTGGVQAANLSAGTQGGAGVIDLKNGAQVRITSSGSTATGIALGGALNQTGGGSAVMNVSGGSSVVVRGPAGLPITSVGYDGTAVLNVSGASSIDLADGNLFIARSAAAVGTVTLAGGSSLSVGWVEVGRARAVGSDDLLGSNAGLGTLIVNASTLTAANIVIGSRGYLGGSGTLVGNVLNFGTFNPGNSPGTMVIGGSYTAGAGGKLVLEVAANGQGGFATDQVVFTAGTSVDLTGLNVEFHFLGATDPSAFQASGGFGIDHFLLRRDAGGALTGLGAAAFQAVSFSAQADAFTFSSFAFNPQTGANFTLSAVPEPGALGLMPGGLVGLAWRSRAGAGPARA